MIIETTPDIVNARLTAVGGLPNGLVLWSKIPEAFPGITITNLLVPYNNDVVKSNLPALITVDGSPIGAPLHAVVYVGNQQLADPWTGKLEPTSKYKALKFVTFKGEWKQTDPLTECLRQHTELVKENVDLKKQIADHKETEKRLISEKDKAVQEGEIKLKAEKNKLAECVAASQKLLNFKNEVHLLVEKYKNE